MTGNASVHRGSGSGRAVLATALVMLLASAALVFIALDPPIDPPGEGLLLLVGSVGLAMSATAVFLAVRLARGDAKARTALAIIGIAALPLAGPLALLMLKALSHYSQQPHSQTQAPLPSSGRGNHALTPITLLLLLMQCAVFRGPLSPL